MENQNRDSKGKFSRSNMYKQFVISMIIVAIAVAVGVWYQTTHPRIIQLPPVTVDTSPEMYAQKIDSLQKSVVEQVRKCEEGKYDESFGLVTYDPKLGGKNNDAAMSYGTLQFKKATVIYYEKSLYGKVVTGKEAILIALDDEQSGALAKDIMFKSPNLATDWLNCSTSLNLTSMIQAIKKIQ